MASYHPIHGRIAYVERIPGLISRQVQRPFSRPTSPPLHHGPTAFHLRLIWLGILRIILGISQGGTRALSRGYPALLRSHRLSLDTPCSPTSTSPACHPQGPIPLPHHLHRRATYRTLAQPYCPRLPITYGVDDLTCEERLSSVTCPWDVKHY